MGKYIKYFETLAEFAKFWNFDDWESGPNNADATMVAYVHEDDSVRFDDDNNGDVQSDFWLNEHEIDATADTITCTIKTGLLYAQLLVDGDQVDTIGPGEEYDDFGIYVGENDTPDYRTIAIDCKFYMDENFNEYAGEINEELFQSGVTISYPPVKIRLEGISSDGSTPTTIGYSGLMNSGRVSAVTYEYNGQTVDITEDWFKDGKDVKYQFPASGSYEVDIVLNDDSMAVPALLRDSEASFVAVYTDNPEDAVDFNITGTLAENSLVSDVDLGEGISLVYSSIFTNMTNLTDVTFGNSQAYTFTTLPVLAGGMLNRAPSDVNAYANLRDSNPDIVSTWTAATSGLNWTWNNMAEPYVAYVDFEYYIDSIDQSHTAETKNVVKSDAMSAFTAVILIDEQGNETDVTNNITYDGVSSCTYDFHVNGFNTLRFVWERQDGVFELNGGMFSETEIQGCYFHNADPDNDGVTTLKLGSFAFGNCSDMGQVSIDKGMTSVNAGAFSGTNISYIDVGAFENEDYFPPIEDPNNIGHFVTINNNEGNMDVWVNSSVYLNGWDTYLGANWSINYQNGA